MRKRMVCLLMAMSLFLLAGCGKKEDSLLTEEEIARANEAFQNWEEVDGVIHSTQISCFFTSFYEEPSQIDLWEFLQYCPIDTELEDSDAEEFHAVLAAVELDPEKFPLPSDYVTPVHRYRKADVSALLKKHAGITVDDLTGTEQRLYLEEYDAFYNFTSDFGPGYFECVGGERSGDAIRFWSAESGGMRKVLTVKERDGEYFIWSFLEEAVASK